jgi:hypothetical protein
MLTPTNTPRYNQFVASEDSINVQNFKNDIYQTLYDLREHWVLDKFEDKVQTFINKSLDFVITPADKSNLRLMFGVAAQLLNKLKEYIFYMVERMNLSNEYIDEIKSNFKWYQTNYARTKTKFIATCHEKGLPRLPIVTPFSKDEAERWATEHSAY